MSRPEIAWLLMIVVGFAAAVGIGFLAILHRERRRRAHWSTRTRAARPHWSIALADRIERVAGRMTIRRRSRRHRRRQDL